MAARSLGAPSLPGEVREGNAGDDRVGPRQTVAIERLLELLRGAAVHPETRIAEGPEARREDRIHLDTEQRRVRRQGVEQRRAGSAGARAELHHDPGIGHPRDAHEPTLEVPRAGRQVGHLAGPAQQLPHQGQAVPQAVAGALSPHRVSSFADFQETR